MSVVQATCVATMVAPTWWARTAVNAELASFLTVSPNCVKVQQEFLNVLFVFTLALTSNVVAGCSVVQRLALLSVPGDSPHPHL